MKIIVFVGALQTRRDTIEGVGSYIPQTPERVHVIPGSTPPKPTDWIRVKVSNKGKLHRFTLQMHQSPPLYVR